MSSPLDPRARHASLLGPSGGGKLEHDRRALPHRRKAVGQPADASLPRGSVGCCADRPTLTRSGRVSRADLEGHAQREDEAANGRRTVAGLALMALWVATLFGATWAAADPPAEPVPRPRTAFSP